MSNTKRRVIEWIKIAAIVLLTVSAVLLGWRTQLFNDIVRHIPLFGNVAELVAGAAEPTLTLEAARPLIIVITDENGVRHGVKYDTAMRNTVYDRTSGIVGEALGSAAEPIELTEDEWRAALSWAGVYFEYIMPVRLSVLDGWLGVRMTECAWNREVRRIFVAFGEDTNRLYFQEFESGRFFGADTASRAQELGRDGLSRVEFAFETDVRAAEFAPYMLIFPQNHHPVLRAANTVGLKQLDNLLSAFGIMGQNTHSQVDDDGTHTEIGPNFSIRIEPHGRVVYRRTDIVPEMEQLPGESEMIERARVIAAETIGRYADEAEVFFERIDQSAENVFAVMFGYYVAGGRVHLFEEGYAARITFSSGTVTEAELFFRGFETIEGERVSLLPALQALAAAGGEFMLAYSYVGNERFEPIWVRHELEGSGGR